MNIVWVRRFSQGFFLLLFLWLCVVSTVGTKAWQLRGWPVNWFLQVDPLAALGTLLTTRTIYAALLWSVGTLVLTVLFGRFFCGFVCPLGTLQHAAGWAARRGRAAADRERLNEYRPWQSLKYYLLAFLLGAAALGLVSPPAGRLYGSLQAGLLDPLSLAHRSINLFLLPFADRIPNVTSALPRHYDGAWIIGAAFLAILFACTAVPRFYCRFVCPLGALLGLFGRFALWRVGKTREPCSTCMLCETDCEGACEPSEKIRQAECVLCMNCLRACPDGVIGWRTATSASGEAPSPDVSRRGFLLSLGSGLLAVPMVRMSNLLGANWNPRLIRPPGALAEEDFLSRCLKCGQCMRICPTNIIQPAGLEAGVEGIWTPALNFRIGTSGCQLNCIACGQVCPTAAIRPIGLDEKLGRGDFARAGPVRLGTAFIDQGRCLPWAMDRACIVCQENCPVSPKAIHVREHFSTTRDDLPPVAAADELTLDFGRPVMEPGRFATGDYYCAMLPADGEPRHIVENTASTLTIASTRPWDPPPEPGRRAEIQIRLQQPYVDPALCTGCGICEHECPVTGIKAIRVTAENESRNARRALIV